MTPVDWVTGAFMCIRRETFDEVGGFDEGFFLYWEDADFCQRAAHAGWTTMYARTAPVVHATARSSRFAPARSLWAFHCSALRYYWKHGSWLARGAGPLVAVGLAGRFLMKLPGRMLVAAPSGVSRASGR
jgi:GT2 family glycosyltransferase